MRAILVLSLLLAGPACSQAPISYEDEDDDEDDDEEDEEPTIWDGGQIGGQTTPSTTTTPSTSSTDTGPFDTGTGSTGTTQPTTPCSGSAPSLTLTCTNGSASSGGSPVLAFLIEAIDTDGDLQSYSVALDYDDSPDGIIDSSIAQSLSLEGTIDAELCAATTLSLNLNLSVDGAAVRYGTAYDWGLILTDSHGYSSDQSVVTCTTPNADGSGDP